MLKTTAATTMLATTAVVARRGVPNWERRAYRVVNDLPDTLAPLAWPPMQAGSLTAPFVVAATWYLRTRRPEPALTFAVTGFATWLAAKGVKKVVGRGRPFDDDPQTNLRLATQTDGSLGFVSGHAAVAFTIAGIAGRHLPRPAAAGTYLLAGVVGLTRMYAGAHFPLDVFGGAALGILMAEIAGALPRHNR